MKKILSACILVWIVAALPLFAQTTLTVTGKVTGNKGAGVSGIGVSTNDGRETTTGPDGSYRLEVPSGWSGRVSPQAEGIFFKPAYYDLKKLKKNASRKDFAASVVVAGRVVTSAGTPLSGVSVSTIPRTKTSKTRSDGAYGCTVPALWTGEVKPSLSGATFSPPTRSYSSILHSLTGEDFTADDMAIQGLIWTYGQDLKHVPVSGVAVRFNSASGVFQPEAVETDEEGKYDGRVPWAWSGYAKPEAPMWGFLPPLRNYTNLRKNQTGQDYQALPFGEGDGDGTLSIKILSPPDDPIPGARVILHQEDGSIDQDATTDTSGLATFEGVDRDRVSFTVVVERTDEEGNYWVSVESFLDVRVWSGTAEYLTWFGDEGGEGAGKGAVKLKIPGHNFAWVEPLSQEWADPEATSLSVFEGDLQSDNKLSLVAFDDYPVDFAPDNPYTNWEHYGSLADQAFSNGKTYTVNINRTGTQLSWRSQGRPLTELTINGMRKGVPFGLGMYFFWDEDEDDEKPFSGQLRLASGFPAEKYWAFANTTADDEEQDSGVTLEWLTDLRLTSLPSGTLDIDFLPRTITSLDVSETGLAFWETEGSGQTDLGELMLDFSDDDEETAWACSRTFFFDPGLRRSLDLVFLQLPDEVAEACYTPTFRGIGLSLVDFSLVSDFDGFAAKALADTDAWDFGDSREVWRYWGFDFEEDKTMKGSPAVPAVRKTSAGRLLHSWNPPQPPAKARETKETRDPK